MGKIKDFIYYVRAIKHLHQQPRNLDCDGGCRLYLPNGNWTYSTKEWIEADIEWQKSEE